MSLVHNERTKLFANALDRASTACFTVGVLSPIVAALYGIGGPGTASAVTIVLSSAFWLLAAVVLHLRANRVLGKLL